MFLVPHLIVGLGQPDSRFQGCVRNGPVTFKASAALGEWNAFKFRDIRKPMEMIIRRFAGTFILASLLLAHYHSAYWLWFTAFVGFNLLQSSFTRFCPLENILRRMGIGAACCAARAQEPGKHALNSKRA